MANLDSASKRASSVGLFRGLTLPLPDGTISVGDRQHAAWAYSGILASAPVSVPDVVGQTQAAGTSTLEGVGFVVAVLTASSSTVAAGLIISQSLVSGTLAASGSTVTITVSLGGMNASSGGYFPHVPRRTKEDIRRSRIEFGVLPPDEEKKADKAVERVVEAAAALAQAKPETQAATDAMQAQQRAEERFVAVYSKAFPALKETQILGILRNEAEHKAAMMEEEFVMSLLL